MLGVVAYLIVPGERRRRASGHFERAALEAARGVRALSKPQIRDAKDGHAASPEPDSGEQRGRQRIDID